MEITNSSKGAAWRLRQFLLSFDRCTKMEEMQEGRLHWMEYMVSLAVDDSRGEQPHA